MMTFAKRAYRYPSPAVWNSLPLTVVYNDTFTVFKSRLKTLLFSRAFFHSSFLEHGVVPSSMKSAYITPILKKADLDSSDPKSYRPISNLSPSYLTETLRSTVDIGSRRRLRSASKSMLVIPTTRRTTLGDRAFSVTAARVWNAVPSSVRSAPSLLQFRRDLKTALFQSSYTSP